jgi:hypothetical protein
MISGDKDVDSAQVVDNYLDDGSQFVDSRVASLEHLCFGGGFITGSVNRIVVDIDDFLTGTKSRRSCFFIWSSSL